MDSVAADVDSVVVKLSTACLDGMTNGGATFVGGTEVQATLVDVYWYEIQIPDSFVSLQSDHRQQVLLELIKTIYGSGKTSFPYIGSEVPMNCKSSTQPLLKRVIRFQSIDPLSVSCVLLLQFPHIGGMAIIRRERIGCWNPEAGSGRCPNCASFYVNPMCPRCG